MLPVWLTDSVTSDLDRAIHYSLLWGLEGVELRTVDGPGNRVPFVNEEKLRRRLEESELVLSAIVPGTFEGFLSDRASVLNEIAVLDETLQFCARVGCRLVVVSAFQAEADYSIEKAVDAFRRAGDRAGRFGVTLVVLNEPDMAIATGTKLGELIEAVDSPAVRAAWNPAASLRAGEQPDQIVSGLAPLTGLVRCADIARSGSLFEPTKLGAGKVGWSQQVKALVQAGYDGPMSLEICVDPKGKTGLHDASTMISLIRKARRP